MALRRVLIPIAVCVIALFIPASGAGASPRHVSAITCAGGPIGPGTYSSITVSGFCFLEHGVFTVRGGLSVAADGGLDGTSCDTHVTVLGGIQVGANAVLALGGSVNGTGCAADTNDLVNGGLSARGAAAVIVHGTRINGGFSLEGGGGSTNCDTPLPGLPFPAFSDVEDSHINGGVSIGGLHTCWLGFIRNEVNGNMRLNYNVVGDPDAIEIGLNAIHGGLACTGNHLASSGPGGVPTNSFDGSPPNPNVVSGPETGQCAGL